MLSKEEECFLLKVDLNIRHYRKLSGYTQEESAEASGLSRAYIGEIEALNCIRMPTLRILYRVAVACGIFRKSFWRPNKRPPQGGLF